MTEEEARHSIISQLEMNTGRKEIIEFLQSKGIEKKDAIEWIKEEADKLHEAQVSANKKEDKNSKHIAIGLIALGVAGNIYTFTASNNQIIICGFFLSMIFYGLFTLCLK